MKVSFIGLGNMGAPLAENILKAGNELTVYSSRKECADYFAGLGAKVVQNIGDLADCDVFCSCVPLPRDVLDLAVNKENLYAKMKPGSIHLELSTIDPKTAKTLEHAADAKGIGYVQATVSKTPRIAAEGKAPFFVGGKEDVVARIMPLLDRIGKPKDVRTIEAACAVKLLSNLIGMSTIALLAEGMRIGELGKMDPYELLDLLLDTGAASFQMKTRGPWIAEKDFKARFSVDLAAKDLRMGCAMAKEWGYEPKIISQTLAYLNEAHAEGLGSEDVCALFKITR